MVKKVFIVAAKRTPIGSFGGQLASFSAPELGALVIKSVVEPLGVHADLVGEIFMGNVLQANIGQAPARQASRAAGLPDAVCATTINKVCASGMKAIMLAAQSIQLGDQDIVVAGGMESMSQVPYYVPQARWGAKFGDQTLVDGLQKDGLTDVYGGYAMGICGEQCSEAYGFTRDDQDDYAIRSYSKSHAAWQSGKFLQEVVPVLVKNRAGEELVTEDEEYAKVNYDKLRLLKPSFKKEGTITAANASTLSDGAAALLLMSEDKMRELELQPLAEIVAFADAEQAPEWFTTTPALATQKVLGKAKLSLDEIDYFEFNEAFSVVPLVNGKLLNLPLDRVNCYGGAVSLGHPLGCSGARIVVTLLHVLLQEKGNYGLAAICNGGGGASALILKSATDYTYAQ